MTTLPGLSRAFSAFRLHRSGRPVIVCRKLPNKGGPMTILARFEPGIKCISCWAGWLRGATVRHADMKPTGSIAAEHFTHLSHPAFTGRTGRTPGDVGTTRTPGRCTGGKVSGDVADAEGVDLAVQGRTGDAEHGGGLVAVSPGLVEGLDDRVALRGLEHGHLARPALEA
jgi:hypothetical protein